MINFDNYSSSRIGLINMYSEHKEYIYSWFEEKYEINLELYPDINKPNIIKYIMTNDIKLKCVCGKIKKWNRNRFLESCGDKNCSVQSRRLTNNIKYGGNSPMSSKEICDKISKQYQSKTQDEKNNIKNKRILTNNNKYGGNAPIHDENVKNKIKQSCISRFGVDNFSKVSNFKDLVSNKISETKLNNDEKIFRLSTKNTDKLNKEYFEANFIDNEGYIKLYESMEFYNYQTDTSIYKFMSDNNINYKKRLNTSHLEKQVLGFLENFIKCQSQVRNYKEISEIDIMYNNSGVEFNGLFWHSYNKNSIKLKKYFENRHLDKTIAFEDLSNEHQLFQIFENEWLDKTKQDIWKSILVNNLKQSYKIFARNTIVKEISSTEANDFILNNHIQGIRNAKIKLGLYFQNELVSVMTFSKPLDNNSIYEYELARFCNKKYTNVIGGASKLLKYFERKYKPKSLLSYANRRWSRGNLYYKLGFELQHISRPNKFIIKGNRLYNRLGYQKHKLENILEIYNSDLSSDENIINNNYGIIWDCGNYVFTKTY